jgi:hypothetical protein
MQVYEAIITETPSNATATGVLSSAIVTLIAPFLANNERHAEQIVVAKEAYRFQQTNVTAEVIVRPFVSGR